MKSGVVKNLMLVISTNNCHGKRFIREELKNTLIRPLKNMQKKKMLMYLAQIEELVLIHL